MAVRANKNQLADYVNDFVSSLLDSLRPPMVLETSDISQEDPPDDSKQAGKILVSRNNKRPASNVTDVVSNRSFFRL